MEDLSRKYGGITFLTRRGPDGGWEAMIHQRDCAWTGSTEAESVANMLNGVARLAADGMIDPRSPERPGPVNDGPVQQCIELLERKLKLLVSESADASEKSGPLGDSGPEQTADARRRLQEARRTIGNVGTALAALCRVESS